MTSGWCDTCQQRKTITSCQKCRGRWCEKCHPGIGGQCPYCGASIQVQSIPSVRQAQADIQLKIASRFGLFERVIGLPENPLSKKDEDEFHEQLIAEIRGSVGESLETVAEWMEKQCIHKQRNEVCPHGANCMAEQVAKMIREMKP